MLVTQRFNKRFESLLPTSKGLVVNEVRELNRLLQSNEKGFVSNEKLIKSINNGRIGNAAAKLKSKAFEWKISSAGRIIFSTGVEPTLIDFGLTHTSVETLEKLKQSEISGVIQTAQPAPSWLLAEQETVQLSTEPIFEVGNYGQNRQTFVEELDDTWLRFLDEPQSNLCAELFEICQAPAKANEVHLIIGGAGTGKTMVLLELAFRLRNYTDVGTRLQLPPGVKEQLEVSETHNWYKNSKSGVVLVDDPLKVEDLEAAILEARNSGSRLVAAIDPTQWTDKRARLRFASLIEKKEIKIHELRHAYRQGGEIGQKVLQTIDGFYSTSSMWAAEGSVAHERSVAERWERVCLREVSFRDDQGIVKIYECDSKESLKSALDDAATTIAGFSTYRAWPKVLIGSSNKNLLPKGLFEFTRTLKKERTTFKLRPFSDVHSIRGTEFESVLVFFSRQEFYSINKGRIGLSKPEWEQLTRPLTFLSRAENYLGIFVLPNDWPVEDSSGKTIGSGKFLHF